jgi:hypothetical protein
MAWFTLLKGEISTACLLTAPADPIRVASSRGPLQGNNTSGQLQNGTQSEHP